MSFDEQPDDLHGECAAEIHRLQAELADCSRSHPHENMTKTCELRTEIARLANQNALLQSRQVSVLAEIPDAPPRNTYADPYNDVGYLAHCADHYKQSALHLAAKLVTIKTAANELRNAYIDQFSSGPFECSTTPELEVFDAAIAQCSPQPNEGEQNET